MKLKKIFLNVVAGNMEGKLYWLANKLLEIKISDQIENAEHRNGLALTSKIIGDIQ